MELPLPAKVDFGKILAPAAAVEGVDGGVVGGGGPGGGEVLRRCADADRRHGGGIAHLPALLILCFGGGFMLIVAVEELVVILLDCLWGVDLTSHLLASSMYWLKFPLLLLWVLVEMLMCCG